MSTGSSKTKDLYKVLSVSRTATTHEIKMAYRKLAMALHPDRNDGCSEKADAFKAASEAHYTLSDHSRRKAYDSQYRKKKIVPPNYRKVYAPRPPPGFRVYDTQRHYDMHYGDGMMKEELERARKRAQAASGRDKSYDYQSPLGAGFEFGNDGTYYRNPYSKAPQGPFRNAGKRNSGGGDIEYEEGHFYDMDSNHHTSAKKVIRNRQVIKDRMHERRRNRIERQQQQPNGATEDGCSIM